MAEEENMAEKIETAQMGSNSRQAEAAQPFLETIEQEQAKIDAIMEKAKSDCGPMREAIAAKKKEMREETGVDATAANSMLLLRKTSRRLVGSIAQKSNNTKQDFKVLYDAMGQSLFSFEEALELNESEKD